MYQIYSGGNNVKYELKEVQRPCFQISGKVTVEGRNMITRRSRQK